MAMYAAFLAVLFVCAVRALEQSAIDTLLKQHNDERASLQATNMYKLSWDAELARIAQKHSDKCHWAHTADGEREWGENMAMIDFPSEDMMTRFSFQMKSNIVVTKGMGSFKSWIREKENVHDTEFSCVSNHGSGTCGHYTQVIWHSSTKLGCGVTNCNTLTTSRGTKDFVWFLVCNYLVPGNMLGEEPYNNSTETKAPCSECNGEDSCDDNKLCIAA